MPFSESNPEGRWNYNEYNPNWDERIRFTVRSLSSDMVVGAGITLRVDGIGRRAAELRRDHAPAVAGVTLEKGDSYFVRSVRAESHQGADGGRAEGYSRT